MIPDSTLDAGETACGDLIMLVFGRMKVMAAGQVLEVVTNDPGAPVDIPAWCRQTGHKLLHSAPSEKASSVHFYIRKKD